MTSKEKWDEVRKKMADLAILESDLIEKFILGSGSGGQKINKTSSCVYLKHVPTEIEIKCQQDRSRDLNRLLARRDLCRQIEEKEGKIVSEKLQEAAKIRRQKKRRSRKSKEKMLEGKKKNSEKKELRKPPKE
jgi:protein subunit release factor B